MANRVSIIASALALALPAGLAAGASAPARGPQPIYAAFTLIKEGRLRTHRCGDYQVTTGTYTGTAVSPDARMAGAARYTSRIVTLRGGATGVGSGTLTIRDPRGRLRHRTTVRGVVTQGTVLNGLVSGSVYAPNQLILANVTIVFDDRRFSATFRLGLESGANTGVAYAPANRCR